jgi:septum formation protein
MKSIVLASSSPRRRQLLEKTGICFTVDTAEIEEDKYDGGDPADLVKSISFSKAKAASLRHKDKIVIAADTVGYLDGRLLGKPHSSENARDMLAMMSDRYHDVITGFTILDTGSGATISRAVVTRVRFKKLSQSQIDDYVLSGEPLDKAGAYAIQGLGSALVDRVEGDYCNVIGLPVSALTEELAKFGIQVPRPQIDCAADSPAR